MMDPEMIGAIKIKDGLFIGDELASTVSTFKSCSRGAVGLGICRCQQGHPRHQLRRQADLKPLGAHRRRLSDILLAGLG